MKKQKNKKNLGEILKKVGKNATIGLGVLGASFGLFKWGEHVGKSQMYPYVETAKYCTQEKNVMENKLNELGYTYVYTSEGPKMIRNEYLEDVGKVVYLLAQGLGSLEFISEKVHSWGLDLNETYSAYEKLKKGLVDPKGIAESYIEEGITSEINSPLSVDNQDKTEFLDKFVFDKEGKVAREIYSKLTYALEELKGKYEKDPANVGLSIIYNKERDEVDVYLRITNRDSQ